MELQTFSSGSYHLQRYEFKRLSISVRFSFQQLVEGIEGNSSHRYYPGESIIEGFSGTI